MTGRGPQGEPMVLHPIPPWPIPGPIFRDRREAGRKLAERLRPYEPSRPVVLGIPRGGVVVAFEVARALGAELDVVVPRKVGAPGNEEYGIGAVAPGGVVVRDGEALRALQVSDADFEAGAKVALREAERRVARYRRGRPPLDLYGRTALLVDDGIATGVTARAAARATRALDAAEVVLAAPVAAREALARVRPEVDRVVVLSTPPDFRAVGLWYHSFGQTTDTDVEALLARAPWPAPGRHPGAAGARAVQVPAGAVFLEGDLAVPPDATGLVLFAHGSGSSRKSPRNRKVARDLNQRGLATLLFDLLTRQEEVEDAYTSHIRFNIGLLAVRLAAARAWVRTQPQVAALPVGLFGASTGAAAALTLAAREPGAVGAVVSRGGRPDLAVSPLESVRAPTLLIVGGEDHQVLALNQRAAARLAGPRELHVVPGAGHLFEEAGALDEVARVAGAWFERHLGAPRAA